METRKSSLSEEDIKHRYITPAIERVWPVEDIRMEVPLTAGRVNIKGNMETREPAKFADYVLYTPAGQPLAIVEAKANRRAVSYGMQQAKTYAEMLDIRFAYISNGDAFAEYDFKTGRELPLAAFPSPDELLARLRVDGWTHGGAGGTARAALLHCGGDLPAALKAGHRGRARSKGHRPRQAQARHADERRRRLRLHLPHRLRPEAPDAPRARRWRPQARLPQPLQWRRARSPRDPARHLHEPRHQEHREDRRTPHERLPKIRRTAKELLAKIRAEKARLIKEKRIKKDKPLPAITDDEKPFDIPESWEWVRLGELGEWCSGATPSRQHPEYFGGKIPWLKTGDLNDGYIKDVPEFITEEGFQHSSTKINPVGSVLIAMYGATIGKLGILQVPATTNQACCACELFQGIYNKYLFYFLLANRNFFIRKGMEGAQPNISKAKIIATTIPLPPLAEQHRMVARLEDLLPLCDALAAQL